MDLVSLVTFTCGSWSEGQHDPYFTVHWFCLISWRLFDVWTSHFWDYESVWPDVWPQNKSRSLWLYFIVQCLCLVFWRLFDVWISYRTFDLKINVGHCDLYFIVQWFYLISWRLFDIWTPYFGIMSQYDPVFDLKICVAHCDLYFIVHWFCEISWKLFCGWTSYFGIMSQYDPRPPNICRSLWPIFHGPLNLPFILKTVWCMNIILLDYESVWHDIWPQNKCIFMVQWFCLIS